MSRQSGLLIAELAHQMALIPLAYLLWRVVRRRHVGVAWWWLASAFAISWLADTAADILPRSAGWVPSLVYPVAQTAIIGRVLLSRRAALALILGLTTLAVIAVLSRGADGPDLMLRATAWLLIVAMVGLLRGLPLRLQACFLVYFGLGLALWMVHLRWLIVATWYPYQAARAAGLLLFCWAATVNDGPRDSIGP